MAGRWWLPGRPQSRAQQKEPRQQTSRQLTASIALVLARAIFLDTGGSDTMSSSSSAADAAAAAVVVVGPPPPPPLFFFFGGMCGGLVGGSV